MAAVLPNHLPATQTQFINVVFHSLREAWCGHDYIRSKVILGIRKKTEEFMSVHTNPIDEMSRLLHKLPRYLNFILM